MYIKYLANDFIFMGNRINIVNLADLKKNIFFLLFSNFKKVKYKVFFIVVLFYNTILFCFRKTNVINFFQFNRLLKNDRPEK